MNRPDLPGLLRTVRRHLTSPTGQRVTLFIASAAFLVGGFMAVRRTDLDPSQFNLVALALLVLVGVPATVAIKALEYYVSARILDQRPTVSSSFKVTILSTSANLLPIPGSALVKVEALQRLGARTRSAVSATAFMGLAWLGMALLLSSAATGLVGDSTTALRFGAGGAGSLLVAFTLVKARVKPWGRAIRTLLGVMVLEGVAITIAATRLVLAFAVLGESVSVGQTFVIALSGVVAAAIGIFPGGLGLREWLAAALAPIVSIDPSSAFLATALDRIVGAFVHGVLAAVLILPTRRRGKEESEDPGSGEDTHTDDTETADPRSG